MPEVLTDAKTIFGAVLNTPFDVFKMYGYAVDQAKANYESIKSGITKIAADAYLTNVNGISIPKEALIVTDLEKNMIAQIWDYLAPIGYTMLLMYFLLTILQDVQGKVRDLDIKYWIMTIMKFVCVDALIYLGPNLVIWGMQLGNVFINYFFENPVATISGEDSIKYINAVSDYFANGEGKKFWTSLSLLTYAYILKAANTIPNFMIALHAASRKIELVAACYV